MKINALYQNWLEYKLMLPSQLIAKELINFQIDNDE